MITLTFGPFSGTPSALLEQVRKGKMAAHELPIALLCEQALAQVQALGLAQRSELLPILAELVLHKLRAFAPKPPPLLAETEEETFEDPPFLKTLVALEEAIAFLEQRSRERARVVPVPPAPLPKDGRLRPLPVQVLVRAAERFSRQAELHLAPETFGLPEAWARIRRFLQSLKRSLFRHLPFKTWAEQTVAFAALLEAKKQGQVELAQAQNFGPLEVELLEAQARGAAD